MNVSELDILVTVKLHQVRASTISISNCLTFDDWKQDRATVAKSNILFAFLEFNSGIFQGRRVPVHFKASKPESLHYNFGKIWHCIN